MTVAAQLGREPRGSWWVEARCEHDFPQVITTPPLVDGAPFPTVYWLTCPWLAEEAGAAESRGAAAVWARRLAHDAELAARMLRADDEYRSRRAALGPADDPCETVGIAGQRDPLATKCVHAHVAAALAGIDDPVGHDLLATLGPACTDRRCAALTCVREEPL